MSAPVREGLTAFAFCMALQVSVEFVNLVLNEEPTSIAGISWLKFIVVSAIIGFAAGTLRAKAQ